MSFKGFIAAVGLLGWFSLILAQAAPSAHISRETFKDPPFVYRPVATLSDHGVSANVMEQAKAAFEGCGYGGVLFSPSPDPAKLQRTQPPANGLPPSGGVPGRRPNGLLSSYPPEASQWLFKALPGEAGIGSYMVPPKPDAFPGAAAMLPVPNDLPDPTLGYMKDAYFTRIRQLLTYAKDHGRKATYYDEVGFPSGMADHTTPATLTRKTLVRLVTPVTEGTEYKAALPLDGTVVSIVAVEADATKRIDLLPEINGGQITWKAPPGQWTVQTFIVKAAKSSGRSVDYNGAVDYMDPQAVNWFIAQAYEPMAQNLGAFFGNTLNMTFFDDVGIYSDDKTWNVQINDRFKARTGRDASLYYPALWGDIGPNTDAARVAFFSARASLLGEGFPKLVTEWDNRHGLEASGHTPGNYDLQPVDMNGDPFKFYRYTNIPMVDVIFGQGFGRGGFKLISSAADEQDKPIVAAETFSSGGDIMGYRRLIELYTRGINRFVTSAFPRTQPVGSATDFAEWAGRTSWLLQGGRHVADIAVLYPIDSLEAHYYFEAKGNPATLPAGTFISQDTDYQAIGEMLVNQVHRDFTFLHPDTVGNAKVKVEARELVLDNKINRESYRVVILPGSRVLSVSALRKVKAYYDAGGTVIGTSLLASKSAEFGQDAAVQSMIRAIFAIDPDRPMPNDVSAVRTNSKGGKAVFIRHPSAEVLDHTLEQLGVSRDVAFAGNPAPMTGNGSLSYIHKVRESTEVFYFGNASDTPIETQVELRGRLKPELWNPATGAVMTVTGVEYAQHNKVTYTKISLSLPQISSMFVVSR